MTTATDTATETTMQILLDTGSWDSHFLLSLRAARQGLALYANQQH